MSGQDNFENGGDAFSNMVYGFLVIKKIEVAGRQRIQMQKKKSRPQTKKVELLKPAEKMRDNKIRNVENLLTNKFFMKIAVEHYDFLFELRLQQV